MVIQTDELRQRTTPVWMCSKCGKKYQTKGQAKAHELKVHNG